MISRALRQYLGCLSLVELLFHFAVLLSPLFQCNLVSPYISGVYAEVESQSKHEVPCVHVHAFVCAYKRRVFDLKRVSISLTFFSRDCMPSSWN